MTFRQFAFNNVRRNTRAYGAYFLSSTFAVMVFFTYAMFIFHPEMEKPEFRMKEMRKAATVQLALLFFLPFAAAAVHTAFALKVASLIFPSVLGPAVVTITGFFVIQLLCFFLVRSRYLHHLRRLWPGCE